MKKEIKTIESLCVADLEKDAVWEFINNDEAGETAVRPVKRVPVTNLEGKVIGTQVCLASGKLVWGLISNVDSRSPRSTEHFLTLSVEREGKWFNLARYHDVDYARNGPESLASFLGLDVDMTFPISYDISRFAAGDPLALAGTILKEPRERLTEDEIMDLVLG